MSCSHENDNSNSGSNNIDPSIIPEPTSGESKNKKGIGTIFDEYLGYNTKDATVFEEEDARYVIYDGQKEKEGKQIFVSRKAVKEGNQWVYGEKHLVLEGSENGWDINISNPSVVKGSFAYQGNDYSYLLAYNGNNTSDNTNNHIGFAVSNDVLGTWIKVGNQPLLKNPENQEAAYGYGSPCLLSYDNLGKGYIFYAVGEINVSFGAVKTYDFSNLDAPVIEGGYSSLPVTGLNDNQDLNVILNAGFAFNADKSKVYMVKDRLPVSNNVPNQSSAIEVAKANAEIIANHDESWSSLKIINSFDTMDEEDEESLGWDEIYSGDFVTDPYGKIISETKLEIIYSTFDEEGSLPKFSSTLASYEVNL